MQLKVALDCWRYTENGRQFIKVPIKDKSTDIAFEFNI